MSRQQSPGERYDAIASKLATRLRYDLVLSSPARVVELMARLNRAYRAYRRLAGPLRLCKVKELP